MFKSGVFSGSYFPVFSPNTGKYRPEKTPYLDNSHAVYHTETVIKPAEKDKKKLRNTSAKVIRL